MTLLFSREAMIKDDRGATEDMRETHHVFPNQESCSSALMHPPSLFPFWSVSILIGALGASCLPRGMTPTSLTHQPRPPNLRACLQNTPMQRTHNPPTSSCLKPKSSSVPPKYGCCPLSQRRYLHSYPPNGRYLVVMGSSSAPWYACSFEHFPHFSKDTVPG